MAEITVSCCCKINLFLQVTGRRSDGYHTLRTLFMPVKDVEDFVTCDFDSAPGIEVCARQPEIPSGKDNLMYRAAELYAAVSGVTPNWKFVLDKNIPVAAGLGGGSSNAAAVFKALNSRYSALDEQQLRAAAVKLGADVPFFLDAVPAWADGIGEQLSALPEAHLPLYIVLVNPGFPVGVRWSFGKLDASMFRQADDGVKDSLNRALADNDVEKIAQLCRNDLGTALFEKFPQLELLKRSMLNAGASTVQVSGSGPTLFALCRSKEIRSAVADGVREDFKTSSGIRIFECEV